MSTSRWKLGSWKRSSAGSRKSDTTPTFSSPTAIRTSAQAVKPSSSSGSGSGSSSGSSGSSSKSGKTTSSRSSTSSSSSPFSWFRSSPRAKGRRSIISRDDPAFARLHKPFTPQNLEHQKLLSTFEWTFNEDDNDNDADDEQRRRRRRRVSLSLSPCASRDATADDYAIGYGYGYGPDACHGDYNTTGMLPPNGRRDTLSDSLAHLSMRRAAGGGFDPAPAV